MTNHNNDLQREIDANFEYFQTQLPGLLHGHRGRYALLNKKQTAGIFDTFEDAKTAGDKLYPDGVYSIQKITDKPLDLGFFSNAMHMGAT